jgi:hypothetical protein
LTHLYRLVQGAELAAAVVGLLSARPRAHSVLAVVCLVLLVFGQALVRFLPALS